MDILATPLGWLMEKIYLLVNNYGVALLLFTLLSRIVILPLSIKQQKSMAKMSAYNPIIQEIQKKYAKDKNKQQEEMMKLYEEYGFSPNFGCLPMIIQMIIMFGLVQVIYRPLRYILGVSSTAYTAITQGVKNIIDVSGNYYDQAIIGAFQNPATDAGVLNELTKLFTQNKVSADVIENIKSFDFTFLGLDLTRVPTLNFKAEDFSFWLLLVPILSAVTMILAQVIMTKASGQKTTGAMKLLPYTMSIMFIWIGFTVPAGVSLYWIFSNVIGLFQSLLLKKLYDPEKMKQQVYDEIEAKKRAKKEKKTVAVKDESGNTVNKEMSDSEIAAMRLAKARAMAEQKYNSPDKEETKPEEKSEETAAEETNGEKTDEE